MKGNLILKKFSVNSVPGTMNQNELRTFFGGKVLYSENKIYINDGSIPFSQVTTDYNYGYQYYDFDTMPEIWETSFFENLSDLKLNQHTISLFSQTSTNISDNTRWKISVNGTNILKEYLFFKIKEQRIFKAINAKDVYSNNINKAIYEYISYNLLKRYRLEQVAFFVKYYDIKNQNLYNDIILQNDPKFNPSINENENLTNITVIGYDPYKFDNIIIQYNQSKPLNQYRFDYYFNLIFTKI
jgi:hypothetical protein